ncbi:MAG TPA: NAD-dependent epimerase/dehydratase family protein [Solirubrobacteraceae bacterium]|jgi:UDP-glucose 4-epimerase|nr:NAD-dependent epimerase/dehydratase family protein [Solirubrobacteraceae bacterium]
MRVLVTGGAGFIGSHVVDKLRAHGHEPVIYDLRPSPWPEHADVDTVIGQVTDAVALTEALADCDAVAHLAAVADVNDVHAEPHDAEQVNARGTAAVLEAARLAKVKRVVYASTIWVYSDTEETTVSETTLLPPPAHLYTATKLAGELYCKSYQELYGINYTILRFGIPYGPRAREAAVIPAFVNKAFAGEPLTLSGDGMQTRRFVYVEDLAEGVVAGLGDIAENRVYNLSSDEDVTIKQIAELVQETVGNAEIVYGPARPGDLGSKIVLSDRAREELGWTASTPFKEGVRRYVVWRREQAAKKSGGHPDPLAVAGEPDEAEACPRKILIVSADIGEGHDLPARAIAREFKQEDPDALISVVNGLPAMGPLATAVLRDNSAFMFRWVPWLFDFQYRLFMEFPPTRWLASRLLTRAGRKGMLRLIKAHEPDMVISTYPGTTQVLGELRRSGRVKVPCYSSITDLAGLRFWAHRSIDLHFITHPESQEEVEEIAGPGSVRWAKPPTSPAFLEGRTRVQARAALGLPADQTVVAVSGGGWGVGDLTGAVTAALSVAEDAEVLCLCGRNDVLRERVAQEFAGDPRVRVMGFTNRMSDVLAAANVLIHSSAGLTVLEAIMRGCPVISYGFGYGHVRVSNHALERFKLAQVAHTEAELGPAIEHALTLSPEPDRSFAKRPSTAALILNSTRRVRPLPAWRVRAVRTVTTATAAAVIGLWAGTASLAYSLISHVAGGPLTAVTTPAPEVGVMVDASSSDAPALARELRASGLKVSVALNKASAPYADLLQDAGEEPVPQLNDSGLVGWFGTDHVLRRLEHQLGWHHHFLYTSNGPSLVQTLMAKGAGGRLVVGKITITKPAQLSRLLHAGLRKGDVVELRVNSLPAARHLLDALDHELRQRHLNPVTVEKLLQDSGQQV